MTQRTERVQKLARQVLGDAILSLKDPRVGFVTITAVRITPDLRQARVAVSVLGTEEERAQSLAGLESAKPVLRAELGRQMRIKYLPELVFEPDSGPAEAERIEALIRKIHEQEQEGAASAGPPEQEGAASAGPPEQEGAASAGPPEQEGAASAGPPEQEGAASAGPPKQEEGQPEEEEQG
ncbi:MAG: 30S ribosome-binding factor RbfA [Actinomycetota bacterium]|nr:30S ribosome-binding factor RbfA [Actinomycetota bacterium]